MRRIVQGGCASYEIDTDPHRLDMTAVHAFLTRSHWAEGIDLATVTAALQRSLCFGLYAEDAAQVGLARLVTDEWTFAYLCDVYVLETHRGLGLGKALIETVCSHEVMGRVRRAMLATRDSHSLYTRFGFSALDHPANILQIVRRDMYKKQA